MNRKEYQKKYQKEYKKREAKKIKEYRLKYYQKNKEILLERNRKWRRNNHEKMMKLLRDYYYKNKEKCNLRLKTREAVKKGLIKKENCFVCDDIKSEIHHQNYNNYLDIVWLCRNCHAKLHKEIRDIKLLKI